MTLDIENERREFEAAYRKQYPEISSLSSGKMNRGDDGIYSDGAVFVAWDIWLAAAAKRSYTESAERAPVLPTAPTDEILSIIGGYPWEYQGNGNKADILSKYEQLRAHLAASVASAMSKDAHDAKRWRAVRALPMAGIYELWVHSNSLETLDRNADIASEEIQRIRTRSVDAAITITQGEKA